MPGNCPFDWIAAQSLLTQRDLTPRFPQNYALQLYHLQKLYNALPDSGGVLDQDLALLDLMWHACYCSELEQKPLSDIAKEGALDLYKQTTAIADLIQSWRTPEAQSRSI